MTEMSDNKNKVFVVKLMPLDEAEHFCDSRLDGDVGYTYDLELCLTPFPFHAGIHIRFIESNFERQIFLSSMTIYLL